MSIRFKFRSSVNFDSVGIENRPSISVAELRAKIIRGKNSQQQQQGFDLVFSDAVTGLEYKGDDSQIPSGSSVIVKRVPGATPPLIMSSIGVAKEMIVKDPLTLKPCDGRKDEIKDFGVGISHVPDSELPQFDLEIDANNFIVNENGDVPGLRLECQKLDSSDISQAIPRGSNPHDNEKNILEEAKAVEQMKLNKLATSNFLAVQSSNLPLELKCSLCQTFFKEAVMIPCCQHSFCDNCIRLVLTEKGRCPKCFSSKCNVENLLPNLSLRQAIEHFLESQMLDVDLDKAMQKYVPDGESGIQARDVSCALTVQRELDMPQSSFTTANGSNQVFMGSSYDQHHRINFPGSSGGKDMKSAFSSQKLKQIGGSGGGHPYHGNIQRGCENFAPPDDFQGENQPLVVPQTSMHGAGGPRNFLAHGGHKRGVRTCFVCGSPDHLMRDCPVSNQNSMFQPGNRAFHGGMPDYGPPYWNGSSMASFRPYTNMYGNAMMSYNASYPVSPFAVPPYMPSMFGGMPGPGGNMGPRPSEYFGLQHCESSRNHSNENLPREQLSDNKDGSPENYHHSYPEKVNDYKSQKHKGPSLSHSEDSLTRRLGRRSQHDKYVDSNPHYADDRHEQSSHSFAGRNKNKKPHAERSNSVKEEVPKSCDWHTEGRHKHHHGESKKYHEKREHCESELSLGNRSAQKDVKRRAEYDSRDSHKKPHSHSDYSFEPISPHEQRHKYKEGDIGHDSRHYRHSGRQSTDRRHDDRRQVDEVRDEHGRHKRKRVY